LQPVSSSGVNHHRNWHLTWLAAPGCRRHRPSSPLWIRVARCLLVHSSSKRITAVFETQPPAGGKMLLAQAFHIDSSIPDSVQERNGRERKIGRRSLAVRLVSASRTGAGKPLKLGEHVLRRSPRTATMAPEELRVRLRCSAARRVTKRKARTMNSYAERCGRL